jgi:hypothetical protein
VPVWGAPSAAVGFEALRAAHATGPCFRQFEPDRPPGLFLAYGRSIAGITIRRNVLDLESDDIAASQLAVDGQIEHRQITRSLLDLEPWSGSPRRVSAAAAAWLLQLSFVPGYPLLPTICNKAP